MKNILIKFIQNKFKCTHKNALLTSNEGYCPDCGEYLVKNYYLVRCSSCDIKREAKLYFNQIIPKSRFCSNCGSEDFYIEKIDKINFIDAKYAIYLKEIAYAYKEICPNTQVWVNKENDILKQITASCWS